MPKAVAALSDTLTRHYKSYTYTNTTGGAQCVTVSIAQNCGNNAIQSVTYLGTLQPGQYPDQLPGRRRGQRPHLQLFVHPGGGPDGRGRGRRGKPQPGLLQPTP